MKGPNNVNRLGHCMGNTKPRAFNKIANILREQGKALCYCISRLVHYTF